MQAPLYHDVFPSVSEIVRRIVDNIRHNRTRGVALKTPVVAHPPRRSSPAAPGRETPAVQDRSADAYRRLRNEIVSGGFPPNERLAEADLALRLDAGRTAIRAALVRLDQEGLVTREPNRGARVRLVSDREALEIEEVRVILEQLIVRHAAMRITPGDVTDLRHMLS